MGKEDITTPNMTANIVQILQNKENNEEKDAKKPKISDKCEILRPRRNAKL
jgi:hypothetical protein